MSCLQAHLVTSSWSPSTTSRRALTCGHSSSGPCSPTSSSRALLRQGTPFYAAYRLRPAGDGDFDDLLVRFDPARSSFLRRVIAAGKQGRVWVTLAPEDVALELGEDRSRIVAALGYLEEQSLAELQPAEARQRYSVLTAPLDLPALVDATAARFERRERAEIERIQRVLELVTADSCQVRALAAYFGEQRSEPCGHCSHCLSGQSPCRLGA